ncbi:MAG TPA: CRISPR-associated protein Cas4 [Chloroflexota bacterium]|nr:CRISPR-associated protein Cas4 [Chloroflexota bacterium]
MRTAPLPTMLWLTVSDVRQHVYCPRIPYFRLGLRLAHRPTTYKMQEGRLAHEATEGREHRRSLRAYGLGAGERQFNVLLASERLGLSGKVDMVIVCPDEVVPVEFKNSTARLGLNHRYQLTAYALLAEERYQRPARRAFVYFIPTKHAQEVGITPAMRAYTKRVLADIRRAVGDERMPEGTRVLGRCRECEFLVLCNDRW